MGIVLQVYYGSDGRVRSALLKLEVGKLKKSVEKLAHLFYGDTFWRKTGPALLAPVNSKIRNLRSSMLDEEQGSKLFKNFTETPVKINGHKIAYPPKRVCSKTIIFGTLTFGTHALVIKRNLLCQYSSYHPYNPLYSLSV